MSAKSDYRALFEASYPRLVAFGVAMCGDRGVAEELAQETLLRAHQRWDDVGSFDSPHAWLRRVMGNLLVDAHRHRVVEERALGLADRSVAATDPDQGLDARETWHRLLAALPPQQRLAVQLFYGEDLSVDDTAGEMGIAVGTVKSALAKARAALRRHLDDDGCAVEVST